MGQVIQSRVSEILSLSLSQVPFHQQSMWLHDRDAGRCDSTPDLSANHQQAAQETGAEALPHLPGRISMAAPWALLPCSPPIPPSVRESLASSIENLNTIALFSRFPAPGFPVNGLSGQQRLGEGQPAEVTMTELWRIWATAGWSCGCGKSRAFGAPTEGHRCCPWVPRPALGLIPWCR